MNLNARIISHPNARHPDGTAFVHIDIITPAGGGKSTLARLIANECASGGKSVVILDPDVSEVQRLTKPYPFAVVRTIQAARPASDTTSLEYPAPPLSYVHEPIAQEDLQELSRDRETVQYEDTKVRTAKGGDFSLLTFTYRTKLSPAALPRTFTPVRISLVDLDKRVQAVFENKGKGFDLVYSALLELNIADPTKLTLVKGVGDALVLVITEGWLKPGKVSEYLSITLDYSADRVRASTPPPEAPAGSPPQG